MAGEKEKRVPGEEMPAEEQKDSAAAESLSPAEQAEQVRRALREMEQEGRQRRKRQRGFLGKDNFFNFSHFWSITLIRVAFFIGFILLNGAFIVAVIGTAFTGNFFVPPPPGMETAVGGVWASAGVIAGFLFSWLAANLLWRLLCEALLVRFRVYEVLQSMDEKLHAWDIERKKEQP